MEHPSAALKIAVESGEESGGKRVRITLQEKSEICRYKKQHPKVSHKAMAIHFSKKYGKNISRRTICEIIIHQDKWKGMKTAPLPHPVQVAKVKSAKRLRLPEHRDLEQQLILWYHKARAQGVIFTHKTMLAKVEQLANEIDIADFSYAEGWLRRFKVQHRDILQSNCHSMPFLPSNALKETVTASGQPETAHLYAGIGDYAPEDIYVGIVTGLFYQYPPSPTLTGGLRTMSRLLRDDVSILLCANLGREKCKPLVVGRQRISDCFEDFQYKAHIDYRCCKDAKLSADVFREFLKAFDYRLHQECRKVLLVLSDKHAQLEECALSNVELLFVPDSSDGILRKLETMIVLDFRFNYRKLQIEHYLQCIESEVVLDFSMVDAIHYITMAWQCVSIADLKACLLEPNTAIQERLEQQQKMLETNLNAMLRSIPADDVMPAKKFLYIDDILEVNGERAAKIEAAESSLDAIGQLSKDGNVPTVKEAIKATNTLLEFWDVNNEVSEEDYMYLLVMKSRLLKMASNSINVSSKFHDGNSQTSCSL